MHPRIVEKELSYRIVGGMYAVHRELGFGFVEAIYARSLEKVLKDRGMHVEREVPISVFFQGEQVGFHRVDMLVEKRVVVEIKSTERLADASIRQLKNYVAAMSLDLGILLHFGAKARYYRVLGGFKDRAGASG